MMTERSKQNQNPVEERSCGSVVMSSCAFGRFSFSSAPVADVCRDVRLNRLQKGMDPVEEKRVDSGGEIWEFGTGMIEGIKLRI